MKTLRLEHTPSFRIFQKTSVRRLKRIILVNTAVGQMFADSNHLCYSQHLVDRWHAEQTGAQLLADCLKQVMTKLSLLNLEWLCFVHQESQCNLIEKSNFPLSESNVKTSSKLL